jgi:hypothetical protein
LASPRSGQNAKPEHGLGRLQELKRQARSYFIPENFASYVLVPLSQPAFFRWNYVLSFYYAYATMRRKWANWDNLQSGFGRRVQLCRLCSFACWLLEKVQAAIGLLASTSL